MAPIITILNNSEVTVASWDAGTVQADNNSAILTIRVWNNKGGTTDVSDLKDVSITTLDTDGGTTSDVVAEKWVRVNIPSLDGTSSTAWTSIGGATTKNVRADGLTSSAGYVIRGTANDGTLTNATPNYATIRLRVHVPLNATPGTKVWKTRLNGYYV